MRYPQLVKLCEFSFESGQMHTALPLCVTTLRRNSMPQSQRQSWRAGVTSRPFQHTMKDVRGYHREEGRLGSGLAGHEDKVRSANVCAAPTDKF